MSARTDSRLRSWTWTALLSVAMLLLVQSVAEEMPGTEDGSPDPAAMRVLSSKLQLLGRLVHAEQLVSRVMASGNDQAAAILGRAEELWQLADASFATGDQSAADTYASDGLAAVSAVSRMVVDTDRRAAADRQRYATMRQRVLDFTKAFQRVVLEKPGQAIDGLLNRQEVDRLLNEAERYAGDDDFEHAIAHVNHAAGLVETALARARDRDTLVHELSFGSPEDEYAYEKQRNMSYRLLMDMLERDKADSQEALARIRTALAENERIRTEADSLLHGGDTRTAIERLEQGTALLARVLRMSGLVF